MASTLHNLLSLASLLFFSIILHHPAATTSQECPYPCYPPPTGPGDNPPVTTTPPVSTTPPVFSTTPPAGIFPFTPPSPYFYGVTPPPPEPRVPWFPYYYKKPPHQDQSSSTALRGSSTTIIFIIFPLIHILNCFLICI